MLRRAVVAVLDLRTPGAVIATQRDTTLPGAGLVIAGVVNLLYAGVYGIWTVMGLMGGGLVAVSQVMAATGVTQAETSAGTVIVGIIAAIAPMIQLVVYVGVGIAALIVLFGGVRLIGGHSKGIVYLAAGLAILGPIVGMVANGLSLCNIGTFGMCLFGAFGGGAGSLVPLLICTPLAVWAIVAASREGYAEADE